jgi:ABC-type phosphate/phosphonate transport system substrate-binding protein
MAESRARLRAVTYLSPGIPLGFFELVCDYLSRELGFDIALEAEDRSSGPMHGDHDPFAEGLADLGFLCSPSYLYLSQAPRPSVELVPAGFVFADERSAGEPVYFSEVVVRAEHPARSFTDLAGSTWGYNDECSLSGYFSVRQRLQELRAADEFFARRVRTGSHLASLEAVLGGHIDSAALDSVALSLLLRERPELRARLRIVDSFGPFPIQPVVVRRDLGRELRAGIARALLGLGADTQEARARFGLERCVPISERHYDEERRALCALGQLADPGA